MVGPSPGRRVLAWCASCSTRFSLLLFLLLLGGSTYVITGWQIQFLRENAGPWLLSVALLILAAAPAAAAIHLFDQFERKPKSMIFIALLWGGVITVALASYANHHLLELLARVMPSAAFESWGSAIIAPLVEEPLKFAGLLVLFLLGWRRFTSPADGVVYGTLIGLGCQTVENHIYFVAAAASSAEGGPIAAVLQTFTERVMLGGLLSHTLYAGLMGYGFAYAVTQTHPPRLRRYGPLGLSALAAVLGHFLWNSPLIAKSDNLLRSDLIGALTTCVFVLIFLLIARDAKRRERAAFSRLLPAVIDAGLLDQQETRALMSYRYRLRLLFRAVAKGGPAAAWLLRGLHREQIALVLSHAAPESPKLRHMERRRAKIRWLKARLAPVHTA